MIEIVVNSPLNASSIPVGRISNSVDDGRTWYEEIRQNHAEIYNFLLNIGAITPKHLGTR